MCQAAKRSFGKETRKAGRPPTRYPRPPDRTGTRPGQPRPLTAAPHSSPRSPPSTGGPPISATRPSLPYDPLPIIALTLGGCAAAAAKPSRRLTRFPRPLPKPKPRVTPQLGRRPGEGGGAVTGRGGARRLGGARGGSAFSANHSGL